MCTPWRSSFAALFDWQRIAFTRKCSKSPTCVKECWSISCTRNRKGSLRFARGTSQTFQTLEGLVKRGVKVGSRRGWLATDVVVGFCHIVVSSNRMRGSLFGAPNVVACCVYLNISWFCEFAINCKVVISCRWIWVFSHELWKEPSAEVNELHKQCFHVLQRHEEVLEDWFLHYQDSKDVMDVLCREHELKNLPESERSCLDEVAPPESATPSSAATGPSAKTELWWLLTALLINPLCQIGNYLFCYWLCTTVWCVNHPLGTLYTTTTTRQWL